MKAAPRSEIVRTADPVPPVLMMVSAKPGRIVRRQARTSVEYNILAQNGEI